MNEHLLSTTSSNYNSFHNLISSNTRNKIIKDLIEPSYENDIDETLKARRRWRRFGHMFETSSKLFLAASGIFSFSSGFFQNTMHNFLAGTCSTLSLASLQFSSYCFKQSSINTDELNMILTSIGIDPVPEFEVNEDSSTHSTSHDSTSTSSVTL